MDTTTQPATGLCLSGGGYRAMLFHVGSLWRLNECGLLPRLDFISSVSGGSITAARLGLAWPRLGFGANGVGAAFVAEVVDPVRELASHTIDVGAIVPSLVGFSAGNRVAASYRKKLL